jgi:hypothetical protein
MLHLYVARFDVTENLEIFLVFRPVSVARFNALFPKQIADRASMNLHNETTSTMHEFHLDVS